MSSGRRGGLNSEINVTPMVDVMLVLLIIFMVAAPMMQQTGVDLQLPQTEATIIPDEEGKLILSIDAKGVAYLSGQVIAWEELEVKLSTNEKVKVDGELYIEADTTLPYGQVLAAMATARRAGVSKLMMMTDPIEHGGPTK